MPEVTHIYIRGRYIPINTLFVREYKNEVEVHVLGRGYPDFLLDRRDEQDSKLITKLLDFLFNRSMLMLEEKA